MNVTPIYAGILALLFVVLSVRVIGGRRSAGVALGDGGDPTLLRRQRVHANFAEYAPLALLLLALAEIQGTPAWVLHLLGAALLVGRSLHAVGVSQAGELIAIRVAGMALTFVSIIGGALLNLGGSTLLQRVLGL